ncbi:CLUMA_CG013797, isoform A [Clunio marinus]|uniref:CLUMA_CG013797, isoform A n=1 Tax=Clunio marinus TaxID=568069 RepID=A0A1J1IK22_9DIPT|nr:CLUMA_CG013797, isoform A [Clunio marinus]
MISCFTSEEHERRKKINLEMCIKDLRQHFQNLPHGILWCCCDARRSNENSETRQQNLHASLNYLTGNIWKYLFVKSDLVLICFVNTLAFN